ncbi:NAD-dependent epimerase/dehydratase family protein [Sulfuracidifex tepidarius]|uniref:NAD-dependent epimerase/dehydratase domain-containing protein n=2 Tax=Sulfuracidifex tepidarius TaxID=1294262 RepID=A0A510DZN4_9CREN|nr:NAD-dependent epimerase/dehydratase family protein [Sulfuracidifex tepidarius]BBG22898.1 hypothetical protein IC006_0182 [Sulfuracidifex tepidarius]BBG25659.1 hypothetical protein IC007_0164 [Sulfuracidifex tepidarius]
MRYLLVGHGFISTHVAEYLFQRHEVKITYRNMNPVKEAYAKVLSGRAELIRVSPEEEEFKKLVDWSDVVVSFVGEIAGDENKLRKANVEVPSAIAKMVKGKPMVHLTGMLGYTGVNVKPELPHLKDLHPDTPFERSKAEAERVLMKISREQGFPLILIRPTLVYGKYGAHVQFVTIYKMSKRGIIPSLPFSFNAVSATDLAKVIEYFVERKETTYFYATECDPVNVTRFFELMREGLGKRGGLRVPVPEGLAKAVLPSYVRSLLKYTKSTFDCSACKEVINELSFREDEIRKNAVFLMELEKQGKLIPT